MSSVIQRLNYFDHQFLHVEDFNVEQTYHKDMRRLHNQVFHPWGIAEGLELSMTTGPMINVSKGIAVDSRGQELVLVNDLEWDLTAHPGKTVFITIYYHELDAEPSSEGDVTGNTRVREIPQIQVLDAAPADPSLQLILGRATVSDADPPAVTSLDDGDETDKRKVIDLTAPAPAPGGDGNGDQPPPPAPTIDIGAVEHLQVKTMTLYDPAVEEAQWTPVRFAGPGRVEVDGELGVTGDLGLGGDLVVGVEVDEHLAFHQNLITAKKGTAKGDLHLQPEGGAIRIHGQKTQQTTKLIVTDTGRVGIGIEKPRARLDVRGDVQCSEDLDCRGDLACRGNITTRKDLQCSGNLACSGSLSVTDDLQCGGNLTANGNIRAEGELVLGGIKPIALKRFVIAAGVQGDYELDTGFSADDYVAAIAGFHFPQAEAASHSVFMKIVDARWQISAFLPARADGATQDWHVDVMFVSKNMGELRDSAW